MPLAVAFSGSAGYPSGSILHHGSYDGRTTSHSEDIFNLLKRSGLESVLPLMDLPRELGAKGNLDDLRQYKSQNVAFETIVNEIMKANKILSP